MSPLAEWRCRDCVRWKSKAGSSWFGTCALSIPAGCDWAGYEAVCEDFVPRSPDFGPIGLMTVALPPRASEG